MRRSIAGLNLRRMFLRFFLPSFWLAGAVASRALARGKEGHEAVGALATGLQHPGARQHVKAGCHLADVLGVIDWKVP